MKLTEIFHVVSEHQGEIHPHALKRFTEWSGEIFREVPDKLTCGEFERHFDTYLTDDEKAKVAKGAAEIAEWLSKCTGIGQELSLEPFSTSVSWPMRDVKQLLKQVYERKDEEDEEERRQAAFEALSPPLQSAKKYLSSEEYKDFESSIPGAVSAHLDKGKLYLLDGRAFQYGIWMTRISDRQKEEERKRNAQSQAEKFNQALNEEIARLKSVLRTKEQSPDSYFKEQGNCPRYVGYSFANLLPNDERQRCGAFIKSRVNQMVPDQFSKFMCREYTISYFLLPFTEYSLQGIPCLDFSFEIFAVVKTKVWIEPCKNEILGYIFTFPWMERKSNNYVSYPVKLREPEFLGYDYQLLTPRDLGCIFWQSIPVVLLRGLIGGEMEPTGTVILEASESSTTYAIDGFDNEVTIPSNFADYLRKIAGIGGLMDVGIISQKLATIVEKTLSQLEAAHPPKLLSSGGIVGFEDKEFIASLTGLGIPMKDAEKLLDLTPRNLPLSEAIKLALQKYQKIQE